MDKKCIKKVTGLLITTMVFTSTISHSGNFFSYRFDVPKDIEKALDINDNTSVDINISDCQNILKTAINNNDDVEEFIPNKFDKSKNIKKVLDEKVYKLNAIRDSSTYSVISDKKNKLAIVVNDDDEDKDDDSNETDDDILLALVDMNLSDYKQELKAGANLRTLLDENQVSDSFDNKVYNDYKNILQNAVNNGAISLDEMNSILNNYVNTLELINM